MSFYNVYRYNPCGKFSIEDKERDTWPHIVASLLHFMGSSVTLALNRP